MRYAATFKDKKRTWLHRKIKVSKIYPKLVHSMNIYASSTTAGARNKAKYLIIMTAEVSDNYNVGFHWFLVIYTIFDSRSWKIHMTSKYWKCESVSCSVGSDSLWLHGL